MFGNLSPKHLENSQKRKLEKKNLGARLGSCYIYNIAEQKVQGSYINTCFISFGFYFADHIVTYERSK